MLKAKEAYNTTKESARFLPCLYDIEEKIKDAAMDGYVSVSMTVSGVDNSDRNIIAQKLLKNGYEVVTYPIGNNKIKICIGWDIENYERKYG